jgi:hypothetical protein
MNCQWVMPKKRAAVRVAIFLAAQHFSLVSELHHHAPPAPGPGGRAEPLSSVG